MLEIIAIKKYYGESKQDFEKVVKLFKDKTQYYFEQAKDHPMFETFKQKYAACVPHVMVYPETGIVVPSNVKKVRVY